MTREDAIELLILAQLQSDPPPRTEPARMAALFVEVTSTDVPDGFRLLLRRGWR